MSDDSTSDSDAASDAEWHPKLGAELFNSTWELIDKPDRTPEEEEAMLVTALASRWHWTQVGDVKQVATGDWQVAHVLSLQGKGTAAMPYALSVLDVAGTEGWDGRRLASAHEGVARACAAAGDAEQRAEHVAAAQAALDRKPTTTTGPPSRPNWRQSPEVPPTPWHRSFGTAAAA